MIEPELSHALEIEGVLAELEALCATPLGVERVRTIRPLAALAAALAEAAKTAQYRELREAGRDQALTPAEARPALAALDKDGLVLRPSELVHVKRLLDAFAEARRLLLAARELPALFALLRDLPTLAPLGEGLARTIDDEGEVLDSASPLLRSLRGRKRSIDERMSRAVDRFFEHHDLPGERIATIRDDRTVVAIRSDLGAGRFGLVHGRSSSGATLFVEPYELVALNNEGIELRDEEREEVERILREWTARLRSAREELGGAAELCAELDFIRARARLAEALASGAIGGSADGSLKLEEARHPLLVLDRRRRRLDPASVVPLDLALAAGETLVITGPNTGGKTVALKTVGLSVLLFNCGLPVAARAGRLPLLASLFIDIGDPQDIAQDLSTFSGHLRRVARPLAGFATPALVLLDELGAGTDPREGAALAVAVVERLRQGGATSIVTSHHEALKRYALGTPGVRAAAVEFDEATLRPTYRLLVDRTGSSNALVIAARLGVPEDVLAHARRLLDGGTGDAERLMTRLEETAREQERARGALGERERELAAERERLQAEIAELAPREEDLRRRQQGAKARLRAEFEARLTRAIGELREEGKARIAALGEGRRQEGKLTTALAAAAGRIRREEEAVGEAELDPVTAAAGPPLPGARVRIRRFGIAGELVSIDGGKAVVAAGGKRLQVDLGELERESPAAAAGPPVSRIEVARKDAAPSEINLIGSRVEEALAAVDKFLDDAVLAALPEVRIIHGHGSGRLRQGLRAHLVAHPQVRSIESESQGGATRALLEV